MDSGSCLGTKTDLANVGMKLVTEGPILSWLFCLGEHRNSPPTTTLLSEAVVFNWEDILPTGGTSDNVGRHFGLSLLGEEVLSASGGW